MNLTIAQIYELALFSGLICEPPTWSGIDAETELSIDTGLIHADDGSPIYEGLRACFAEYPEEGYIQLEEC